MNDDFDVSEGEDSDFEGDGVYSYHSDAFGAISNIEELNFSPLPAIASGDEEPSRLVNGCLVCSKIPLQVRIFVKLSIEK